jgi:hypothetical protein
MNNELFHDLFINKLIKIQEKITDDYNDRIITKKVRTVDLLVTIHLYFLYSFYNIL